MKDINQLLDKIEERANKAPDLSEDVLREVTIQLQDHCLQINPAWAYPILRTGFAKLKNTDVPALVKALRRAIQGFQLIEVCDQGQKDDPDRVVAVKLILEWVGEIAAILNQK